MSGQPRQYEHGLRAAVASGLADVSLGPATRFAALPDPFHFWRGGELREGQVAYETWGQLNQKRDNAVLIFTGMSPPAHAASSADDPTPGWWEEIVGPGRPLDTEKYFIICSNVIGGCMGSTGPASTNPATGKVWGLDFPIITIPDMVRAQTMLLDRLTVGGTAA